MKEKIQKILANSGFGSRRELEKKIYLKKLYVNNKLVKIGMRINENDIRNFILDGKKKHLIKKNFLLPKILLYHKKNGEICSNSTKEKENTVFQKIPKLKYGKWISIGRLDLNSSGLLLFTSSGKLANSLMHPKNRIERKYKIRVFSRFDSEKKIHILKNGVKLDDGFAKLTFIKFFGGKGKNKWYIVSLNEGRNREIRRIWKHINCQVNKLIRISFGKIKLPKNLFPGCYKELNRIEVKDFLSSL
ncbi:Ribosomal large subunit pseudouridine synthase B [Buchnera aphidicola (Tetraneura ulmi)]|uniref:pseudouridine synthase n=1 Tax=Buchnera aphidicola TaxID=9 RepID=UPI0034645E61